MDPQSGRLMGFRADFTPQVARIDAHTLRREGPSRLCYAGSVLHAQPRALSTSRSPIQLGAELYGDASPTSDVEVISLMLATLQLTDAGCAHGPGHVGIYRAWPVLPACPVRSSSSCSTPCSARPWMKCRC